MNFSLISLSEELKSQLSSMEQSRRMPHALIITGGSDTSREEFVRFLCMWAVCKEADKPCSECSACIKVKGGNHIDVYTAKGTGKTNSISVEEIRNITRDSIVIPNDADRKVYILTDADKRMNQEALNAFLKTMEEPSQNILFLLTAESLKALPQTILSRCTALTLENDVSISAEIYEEATNILKGIVGINELELLKATAVLSTRAKALELLPVVRSMLCDALSLSVNAQGIGKDEICRVLSKKLTKSKLIALMDATSDAISKVNRNVGLTLLSTWLCGEYRRITSCVM